MTARFTFADLRREMAKAFTAPAKKVSVPKPAVKTAPVVRPAPKIDRAKLEGDIAASLVTEAYWRSHRHDSPQSMAKYEAARKRAALGLDLQISLKRSDATKR